MKKYGAWRKKIGPVGKECIKRKTKKEAFKPPHYNNTYASVSTGVQDILKLS